MDQNGIFMEYWYRPPFGKHIKSYWTSPFFIGISFVNEQLSVVMLVYWGIEMISLNKRQHRPTSSNYWRSEKLLPTEQMKPQTRVDLGRNPQQSGVVHSLYIFSMLGGSVGQVVWIILLYLFYSVVDIVCLLLVQPGFDICFLNSRWGNIFNDVVWQGGIFVSWNMLKAPWSKMTCLDSHYCAVIPCLSTCLQAIRLLGTADGLPPWLARSHSFSEMSFSSQAARCGESIWRQQKRSH